MSNSLSSFPIHAKWPAQHPEREDMAQIGGIAWIYAGRRVVAQLKRAALGSRLEAERSP